jgi:hypothetical protein
MRRRISLYFHTPEIRMMALKVFSFVAWFFRSLMKVSKTLELGLIPTTMVAIRVVIQNFLWKFLPEN